MNRIILFTAALVFSTAAFASSKEYTKAATYFGSAWPINYWNSNHQKTDLDFSEMKNDGFNAVILVVPWGEFQPRLDPVGFNEDAYIRLTKVCQSAKAHGLRFFMRVSYLWDMYPGTQQPHLERTASLFSNDSLAVQWQSYLQRVAAATQGCADGSFLSWEDFWHMIEGAASPKTEKESAILSSQTGFDTWAEKYAGKQFKSNNAASKKRLGAYPFPARDHPDFRTVFEWFDSILIDRLLPAAAKHVPNISMEVRVDDDPIYDGKKLIEWFSHKKTYKIPSSPYVMTYWAPAMGARNAGEVESAKKVQDRFSFIQKKISQETKNKIFIDQFLFLDNTPSASKNATIASEEVGGFIKNMAKPLMEHTSGYALWGMRDYYGSVIFNGSFNLKNLGWQFSDNSSIKTSQSDYFAKLPKNSAISQPIPKDRNHFRNSSDAMTLRFRARGKGIVNVSYAGKTVSAKVNSSNQNIQMAFPQSQEDSVLDFYSKSGTVELTDIYLFSHTQRSGVRDPEGRALRHLADIKALNDALTTDGAKPSRFSAGDQSIQNASGVFAPEFDNGRWFAWAGPEVKARILVKTPAITVRGFMQTSTFKRTNGCTLSAYVNGTKTLSRTYTSNETIDLQVPVPSPQKGTLVDLTLSSTCQINPKKQRAGEDDRTLSFILNEISAQPLAKSP